MKEEKRLEIFYAKKIKKDGKKYPWHMFDFHKRFKVD